MPTGSARAYLKHSQPHHVIVDGKEAKLPSGTKVAIHGPLEKHHDAKAYGGHSLGAMQNKAESETPEHHRILSHVPGEPEHHLKTNHNGIFPPLLNHDHEHHEWSHVGHVENISPKEFKDHTKTAEHPKGISHQDLHDSIERQYRSSHGQHWGNSTDPDTVKKNKHLDHVDTHPLVRKFAAFHKEHNAPADYDQINNLGLFHHPDGSKHVIVRDHGYSHDVHGAYAKANRKKEELGKRGIV
jgi:hypothetical protein